jgi:hypothetical protein
MACLLAVGVRAAVSAEAEGMRIDLLSQLGFETLAQALDGYR